MTVMLLCIPADLTEQMFRGNGEEESSRIIKLRSRWIGDVPRKHRRITASFILPTSTWLVVYEN